VENGKADSDYALLRPEPQVKIFCSVFRIWTLHMRLFHLFLPAAIAILLLADGPARTQQGTVDCIGHPFPFDDA
jgi:hypothetical protein